MMSSILKLKLAFSEGSKMVRVGWSAAAFVLVLIFALLQCNFEEAEADKGLDAGLMKACNGAKDPNKCAEDYEKGIKSAGGWKARVTSGALGAGLSILFFWQ